MLTRPAFRSGGPSTGEETPFMLSREIWQPGHRISLTNCPNKEAGVIAGLGFDASLR